VQLALLILAVPAQYFICKLTTPSVGERDVLMRRLTQSLTLFSSGILEWEKWKDWILMRFDDRGECPAKEVLQFKDPAGHFGMSAEVRSPRPSNVKYRVGQVIRHKLWNYRAVIVGWDPKLKAPDFWRDANHPADKKHWKDMPNYALLVDTRDRPSPQITYVPEENIEVITGTKIFHDEVEEFFEYHDGAVYIPRPWLKKLYPHD
ncbi:predicted protein, partial [Nematostella vectensis]